VTDLDALRVVLADDVLLAAGQVALGISNARGAEVGRLPVDFAVDIAFDIALGGTHRLKTVASARVHVALLPVARARATVHRADDTEAPEYLLEELLERRDAAGSDTVRRHS